MVGTLITDNFGVSLPFTTAVFAMFLSLVFALWYYKEKTLSIHKINSINRELFYWATILFTFALGTATGDLLAEKLELGYLLSTVVFASLIILDWLAYKYVKLNAVVAFWIAYILTRPLGASIGDYLSQSTDDGGLGLGTVITSVIFLTAILTTVIYLIKTKRDVVLTT